MEVSIVILSFKMKRLVRNCLRSIMESQISVPYEIIVVDNDSNDGIKEMMAQEFPQIKLIISKENRGMGAGNNLGIRQARGKYILIMNPDIYVFEQSIDKMYNKIKTDETIGLLAPRLLNPDKTLQYTCYRWYKFMTPILRRTFLGKISLARAHIDNFLMKDFDHLANRQVDWCQGSCFVVPRRVFDKVGLFDEIFFMYFEDTDLCRRIWDHGFKVLYQGENAVIHMHQKMSNGGVWQLFTNKLTWVHFISWLKFIKKYNSLIKNKN